MQIECFNEMLFSSSCISNNTTKYRFCLYFLCLVCSLLSCCLHTHARSRRISFLWTAVVQPFCSVQDELRLRSSPECHESKFSRVFQFYQQSNALPCPTRSVTQFYFQLQFYFVEFMLINKRQNCKVISYLILMYNGFLLFFSPSLAQPNDIPDQSRHIPGLIKFRIE